MFWRKKEPKHKHTWTNWNEPEVREGMYNVYADLGVVSGRYPTEETFQTRTCTECNAVEQRVVNWRIIR